ncbi:MAG TPA: EamA family transporter, partial [Saprospiraceae bacterium]|nr:EamA family transporter [Saprospiraceae bacterium]
FISLVFSLALETNGISSLNNMTSTTYLAIAYLVVFGSYVGYSAFLWLIKNASPLLSTTYAYVNPLVAIIIGAIIGGEYLEPRVLIACMIILSGVILLIIGRRKFSLT